MKTRLNTEENKNWRNVPQNFKYTPTQNVNIDIKGNKGIPFI